jgi:DNA-binding FrmR family transcriptional regulator
MNVDELDASDVAALHRRLRRIEGQIRGLQRALDEGGDCRDVLRQFTAASSALRAAGMVLAVTAFESCIQEGDDVDAEALRRTLLSMS